MHTGKPVTSQAAALEPMLSSELTVMEERSSSFSPSPVKAPATRKRQIAPKKTADPEQLNTANKCSIHVVSPDIDDSDAESPPKRSKKPSTISDSSIEIGEVQPAPRPKRGQASKITATGKTVKTAAKRRTRSAPKAKINGKSKSAEYVEDSDEEMKGVEEDLPLQVPGACFFSGIIPFY